MSYNWDILNEKTYNNRTGYYKFKHEYNFIINNSKNNRDKILDIGGGSGRFSIPLMNCSNKITVIDINKTAINILKERSNNNINVICADFIKNEFQETFSLILCIEVLGYFPDFEVFFKKLNKLIAVNGRIIITYDNPNSWRFLLRRVIGYLKITSSPHNYNHISFKDLKRVLTKCNLVIDKMEGMNWTPLPLYSNSKLVAFFAFFEKIFRLNKWYSQSPWVLMSIRKQERLNEQ